MKQINLKIYEKDRIINNNNDKIRALFNLGYDLTKNRKQGKMFLTYNQRDNQISSSYTTYNQNDIERGKIVFKNFFIPINIIDTVKKHYNCQNYKNKNRKLKRFNTYNIDKNTIKICNKVDKIHAISRHPNTSIVAIDIDNHNNTKEKSIETFKYIIKKYYDNIVYTEMSQDYGFHLFINFNTHLNQKKLKTIQQSIISEGFNNIEIIGANNSSQLLRLIDSPHYIPIKFNKDFSKWEQQSEKEYLTQILNFNYSDNKEIFIEPKKISIKEIFIPKEKEYPAIPIFIKKNTNLHYRNKQDVITYLNTKYPFSAGQRVDYMKKIASACLYYNLSSDDYINITLSNNCGSKDLNSWDNQKINKIYTEYYNTFCNIIGTSNQHQYKYSSSTQFYSNIDLYNENINTFAKEKIKEFSNVLLKKTILPSLKYKKWKDEYYSITFILIKEIIGSIIYQTQNSKTKNPLSNISQKKYELITKGYQFSRKQLEFFKQHYKTNINIHKLFNLIIKNSIFTQFFHNNSGYCFNKNFKFSRQFMFKKINNSKQIYNNILINITEYIKIIENNLKEIYKKNKIRYNMLKVCFVEDFVKNVNHDFFEFFPT